MHNGNNRATSLLNLEANRKFVARMQRSGIRGLQAMITPHSTNSMTAAIAWQ